MFLLSGALGLRTRAQCDSDPTITRDSQRISCYRAAAITSAYAGDSSGAVSTCNDIWSQFGANPPSGGNSGIASQAELLSNSCYDSVAKILRDPSICGYIQQRNSLSTGLFGTVVTKDLCIDEVTNLEQLNPANYYNNPSNTNICMAVFILPFIAIGAFLRR